MFGLALVSAALLAIPAADPPRPQDDEKAAPKAVAGDDPGKALAEYNARRAKTPATAAAQWRLGLWCEQHGLKPEAYVHFAEVVRLDPKREAAWRKLGFKKLGGRWTTDEQLAEEAEQKKAEKIWAPQLRKVHKDIHGTNGAKKQAEAQAVLDAINDPRAIPSVYREFGGSGQLDQLILIQVLGQLDQPLSSKVLAMLAVFGSTPEVQRRATETLRGRPADDFLPLLVALMTDPLKYDIRPVGGPGSPGVLFVEGERFNVSRFYAPSAPPNIATVVGDLASFQQYGAPVLLVPAGQSSTSPRRVPGSNTLAQVTETTRYAQISPVQMIIEAQKAAIMAQAQLESDVASIQSINQERKTFNDRVMAVAKGATGKDHGSTPKEWRDALAAGTNSSKQPSRTPFKPTFGELVPLAYNPFFVVDS
jgi:hypothetical protein